MGVPFDEDTLTLEAGYELMDAKTNGIHTDVFRVLYTEFGIESDKLMGVTNTVAKDVWTLSYTVPSLPCLLIPIPLPFPSLLLAFQFCLLSCTYLCSLHTTMPAHALHPQQHSI